MDYKFLATLIVLSDVPTCSQKFGFVRHAGAYGFTACSMGGGEGRKGVGESKHTGSL